MHAIAGTIGHDLITDEYARQQAKQASRERVLHSHPETRTLPGRRGIEYAVGGTSTPSTPASPPHDAEAARGVARLEAAKHLEFLALVRAWADGDPVTLIDKGRVEDVIDVLEHLARQAKGAQDDAGRQCLRAAAAAWFGKANAYREAALLVRDLLR